MVEKKVALLLVLRIYLFELIYVIYIFDEDKCNLRILENLVLEMDVPKSSILPTFLLLFYKNYLL